MVRLYIDDIELSDSEMIKVFKNNPLDDFEPIEEYCKRVFGNKYGIIVNYGEKYSEILADEILGSIQPLLELIGTPAWGLELTTFIGNYGWTPLGIHTDQRGENVLHYHLGPGEKKMYVWDEDLYNKVSNGVGGNNKVNLEELVKTAKEFIFAKGDLYYMPWDKHHVGYTAEFSVAVTLWFNNPTRYDFSKLMIETIKNICLKNDQSIIESQIDYQNNHNTFLDFIASLNVTKENLESPLEKFLEHIYFEYKKCLISNGGWQNTPLNFYRNIDLDTNSQIVFSDFVNQTVKAREFYAMNYEIKLDRLIIYVRGTRLSFKFHQQLIDIMETINSGLPVAVTKIFSDCKDLPEEVIFYFLKLLINHKGVQLIQTEAN